jgi:indolepyruvate ferredoxin oxidoreductase beta subunit
MTLHDSLPLEAASTQDPRLNGIIKLAILAVGGQGGGVLTNWIEDMARSNGYAAQATSVAGVAQRTGATVYYLEMAPHDLGTPMPVFSLMPAAGDVDVMIAAEMMEAGRAIMRGFVTPDRTTLIASTHRALAVSEKMAPGDGIASSDEVIAAAEIAARRFIAADFDQLAVSNGSVISAALFGALAGAGVLPFDRSAYEQAIRASGKGVAGSLRAFAAAYDACTMRPVAGAAAAINDS